MMHRHELTLEEFAKVEHILPGSKRHVGVTAKGNHNFFDATLWILKSGAPWRNLPLRYGKWKNVHRRFTRWSPSGVFEKILAVRCDEKELAMVLMDSTALSAPQYAAGAKKAYRMRA